MPPCSFATKPITTEPGVFNLYHALFGIQKLEWDSNGFQRNGHEYRDTMDLKDWLWGSIEAVNAEYFSFF